MSQDLQTTVQMLDDFAIQLDRRKAPLQLAIDALKSKRDILDKAIEEKEAEYNALHACSTGIANQKKLLTTTAPLPYMPNHYDSMGGVL